MRAFHPPSLRVARSGPGRHSPSTLRASVGPEPAPAPRAAPGAPSGCATGNAGMAPVDVRQVDKFYGSVQVLHRVSVNIPDGEFVVLVGPSGCGKSTLLRMSAGVEEISRGEIAIGERVVNNVPPKDRDIAMVFQNYALYPHMTVKENMAFGLKLRGMPRAQIHQRVMDAAKILDIEHLMERKPKALSGGQRQRVAVGRAIVREPAAFL